jgi:hypothetical protein
VVHHVDEVRDVDEEVCGEGAVERFFLIREGGHRRLHVRNVLHGEG